MYNHLKLCLLQIPRSYQTKFKQLSMIYDLPLFHTTWHLGTYIYKIDMVFHGYKCMDKYNLAYYKLYIYNLCLLWATRVALSLSACPQVHTLGIIVEPWHYCCFDFVTFEALTTFPIFLPRLMVVWSSMSDATWKSSWSTTHMQDVMWANSHWKNIAT